MLNLIDVRLILLVSAAVLFLISGEFTQFFVIFAQQMANPNTIVPICSCLGFASVLKLTECDIHLTHLLITPLRYGKWLLIPGGIIAAYIVNMAIVSQSSVAAIIGTVIFPILQTIGVLPIIGGSLLLLGSSMGGELFNPGAVEIVKLAELTQESPQTIVARVIPIDLLASITTLIVFSILALILSKNAIAELDEDPKTDSTLADLQPFNINFIKALVPIIPLVLLFIVPVFVKLPQDFSNSISIAAAMLIGVFVAGLTIPKELNRIPAAFFEGAGLAYTNIISVLIVATLFTESLKANGLTEIMTNFLTNRPLITKFASIILAFTLAVITGSGVASAIAVMNVLVPGAKTMNLDPIQLGGLTIISAQLGRTLSPVAAVTILTSMISNQTPITLCKCVAIPILSGLSVLCLAGLFNVF